jgi:hypothetical protein
LPLIPSLSSIPDKQLWGGVFRFGMLAIPQAGYGRIATAMLVDIPRAVIAAR